MSGGRLHDVGDIARMLGDRAEDLAYELLPKGKRSGVEWRCGGLDGEPGQSLGVRIRGGKRGIWADFATGECGDALDLVAQVLYRGDKGQALSWARTWLGIADDQAPPVRRRDPQQEQREAEADERRTAASCKRIWLQGKPLAEGDPVWSYLAGRGIDLALLPRKPGALRFHPELWCQEIAGPMPAMVAAITVPPYGGSDGGHRLGESLATAATTGAVHRTWLEQVGGQWRKAKLKAPKKVLGRCGGGWIPLSRGLSGKPMLRAPKGDIVAVGEGIETTLSMAVTRPEWRYIAGISLGNIAQIRLADVFHYVCLLFDVDDYDPGIFAAKRKIVAHFTNSGHDVRRLSPPLGFGDWNDWLQAEVKKQQQEAALDAALAGKAV